jgi:hypothetical protein
LILIDPLGKPSKYMLQWGMEYGVWGMGNTEKPLNEALPRSKSTVLKY